MTAQTKIDVATATATATATAKPLATRIAEAFNGAYASNRAQLVVLHEALVQWHTHGDSVPIRYILTRANGRKAKNIAARAEKLKTCTTINRIVHACVDKSSVSWKFDELEPTGMKNPRRKTGDNGPCFDLSAIARLGEFVAAQHSIIGKDVAEYFKPVKAVAVLDDAAKAAKFRAMAERFAEKNGISLAVLKHALDAKATVPVAGNTAA